MLTTSFLPLVGVLLATFGAWLVPWRRLPPRAALWSLNSIGAVAAAVVAIALSLLSGGFVLGTRAGAWLVDACSLFAGHHQIPAPLGFGALALSVAAARRVATVVTAVRTPRLDGARALTVVEADAPIAFARSGRHGGVVVSTGMLDALAPAERRVLFAHERAHVAARHDVHLLVHQLAAAILPWLTSLRPELQLAAERAADAAALAEVGGDRRLVACAIARAAIAADRHSGAAPALAFTGGAVAFRVRSMLAPDRGALVHASATVALAMMGAVAAALFVHRVAILLSHICT